MSGAVWLSAFPLSVAMVVAVLPGITFPENGVGRSSEFGQIRDGARRNNVSGRPGVQPLSAVTVHDQTALPSCVGTISPCACISSNSRTLLSGTLVTPCCNNHARALSAVVLLISQSASSVSQPSEPELGLLSLNSALTSSRRAERSCSGSEDAGRVSVWLDPDPKSCSIQKQNSGMIKTPLNGGGADEKVTIH